MNAAMKDSTPTTPMPRLRFPEFREPWGTTTVGSFFDLSAKAKKIENFDRERLLTVKLHGNGVVKNEKATLTGGANYFMRTAGQFIFSKIDLLNGAFGVVPDALDGFASSSDVPAYSFKDRQCSRFFLYWLRASYERLAIERTGTSNTLKRVSPDSFLALPLLAPSPNEQQKIADCLTSLDEAIAAQARKVEALKAHKKGLMQHLFPQEGQTLPRLRFPEFRDGPEWETKEVGDVFRVTRGEVLAMPLVSDERSADAPYPVYSSQTKNLGLAGYFSDFLYEDAITWTTDGANAGEVNYRAGKFYCTNVCGVLLSAEGHANACVAALLNAVTRNHVSYVGNPKLMNGVMAKITIPFPPLAEQQRIADCLDSLDVTLAATAAVLAALTTHKSGLMQGLFPAPDERN